MMDSLECLLEQLSLAQIESFRKECSDWRYMFEIAEKITGRSKTKLAQKTAKKLHLPYLQIFEPVALSAIESSELSEMTQQGSFPLSDEKDKVVCVNPSRLSDACIVKGSTQLFISCWAEIEILAWESQKRTDLLRLTRELS